MGAAPVVMIEGGQRFSFGGAVWKEVERFDNSDVHAQLNKAVQGTQGVDFICITRSSQPRLTLVEVKDYRHANASFPSHPQLAMEVAAKVAGTLVGLVAASRNAQNGSIWHLSARYASRSSERLQVVLHVESKSWLSAAEAKAELAVLVPVLESKLAWLDSCSVIACTELATSLADCTVTTP